MRATLLSIAALFTASIAVADEPLFRFLGDETLADKIESDPKAFLGRHVIMVGGLETDTWFFDGYQNAASTHYCFEFVQIVSKDPIDTGERLRVYLKRNLPHGASEAITEKVVGATGRRTSKLCRIKAVLDPHRFRGVDTWNMLELVDVQFNQPNGSWGPWIVQEIGREIAEEEREEQAALAARKQSEAKAADEKKIAADTRTWKSGTYSVTAQFISMANGKVVLKRLDGSTVAVEIAMLSDEDREWLKRRSR